MADPHRDQESVQADGGVTRDARIEELLLTGLDHYFAARYAEAINVWTRVLFLDRAHARARAYIERARGAVAERQRESDELLQRGVAAFDQGDGTLARRLLTHAVERGASHQEEALAVLARLDRLEAASFSSEVAEARPRRGAERTAEKVEHGRGRAIVWLALVAGLGAVAVVSALLTGARGRPAWISLLPARGPDSAVIAPESLPVLQPAEVALLRARSHYQHGRLHEALAALDAVARADRATPEADELRAEIQRALLAASGARRSDATPAGGAR